MHPIKWLYLLLCLLGLTSSPVSAQDYCDPDAALRLCNLDGRTYTHTYSATQTTFNAGFELASCKLQGSKKDCHKSNAPDYELTLTGDEDGTNYYLTGPGGARLPISLTFTDGTNATAPLTPANPSDVFTGTVNLTPVAFNVTITPASGTPLTAGTYSAVFSVDAVQTKACGSRCDEQNGLTFTLSVVIPAQIVVKNIDDIELTPPLDRSAPIEQEEPLCIGGYGFSRFVVRFSSDNGSTGGSGAFPFQLNGTTSGHGLPYSVAFINDLTSATGVAAASDGSVTGAFNRRSDLQCANDNARILVSLTAADWTSATDTNYQDTLRITVVPE